jgi:hypothetical protein
MRYKKTTALIFFIAMTSVLFIGVFSIAVNTPPAESFLPDAEPLDIGQRLRTNDYGLEGSVGGLKTSALPNTAAAVVGDVKTWLTLDDYYGYYFFADFELRAIGIYGEVWVQVNRSYERGDIRNDPYYVDGFGRYHYPEITDAQVAYLLDQFDNNIYPKDVQYFGEPDFHDGSMSLLEAWGYVPPGYYGEDTGRTAILVANVRDWAYYDSSYPYYIAGFFSSTLEAYFDRNAMTIDSHQWYRRTGDEGETWDSEIIPGLTYPPVDRPNLYESIFAHEYQHLIHSDYNPDDPSWMNEACSLIAEPLCGYPVDYGQVQRFLFSPDNSLTAWGDQGDLNILADYGSSFLWASYLLDHYGGDAFISQFVQGGIPGVDGIEATLDLLGYTEDFIDVYRNWRIANLIQADHGKYGYKSLDLDPATNPDLDDGLTVHEISGSSIPWTSGAEEFGNTFSWDGDDTGISEIAGFGTEYIHFPDLSGFNFIFFDGDDTSLVPGWEFDGTYWYSGARDLTNSLIFGAAHVDGGNPTLTMTTYWDIEDYWDFGFVQVSTDNGETWTSLANEYTTSDHDPDAIGTAIDNLPGLTSWSEFIIEGGWVTMDFDLSAYAGQDILIGLRYVTDWATVYEGWYVEDTVTVSGAHVEFEPFFPEADFMVSLVEKTTYWGGKVKYRVRYMHLWDAYEYGATVAFGSSRTEVWLVVSPIMEAGFVDYEFKNWRPFRHRCRW